MNNDNSQNPTELINPLSEKEIKVPPFTNPYNTEQLTDDSPVAYKINKLDIINKARGILRGERTLNSAELGTLIKELVKLDQFSYATEVLLVKMKWDEENGKTIQEKDYENLAKFIYKDHSLPSAFKFKKALQELTSHENISATKRCETLGLAGAIYKRKWQFDHQFKNLIVSRYYYKKGYELWKEFIKDPSNPDHKVNEDENGFNAINYAYINELMAIDKLEEHGRVTGLSGSISESLKEAHDTRMYILDQFVKDAFTSNAELLKPGCAPWIIATVAEAYFGLCYYDHALIFSQKYINHPDVQPWEKRTFSQQLYSISYLQFFLKSFNDEIDYSQSAFGEFPHKLSGKINVDGINNCLLVVKNATTQKKPLAKKEVDKEDKQGIALSGGGFRAAFFHIGVFAALAEKNLLKDIEVISCVSGGSIIGAFYYLKLKKLLETKNDDEITRKDYIQLVQEMETAFLSGVQNNLRMMIFSDFSSNLKMFNRDYSRSHRLGELYEEFLFKDLITVKRSEQEITEGKKDGEIYMSDLFIKTKDAPPDFSVAVDNWKRTNRIPQLVLNATSLNTGHNWQFTASWMGEPPGNIQPDIDVKPRLRRMYYEEAPGNYKNFRLGFAVAASSCVPVMFKPLPMFDLYPGIDLQLIDGGVQDNQGIGALIEQECRNMIISDGSGQMPTNNVATKTNANLFFRSDTILQERLRELQFLDIKQRNASTQVNKLVTAHLKSDLENRPINWKYCTDPPRTILYENVNDSSDLTRYGILRNVQLLLSEIRTDLDSFNDKEALALMYSGYAQINFEYKKQSFDNNIPEENLWEFTRIKPIVTQPNLAAENEKLFKVARRVPFKVFYLSDTVKWIVLIIAAIPLLFLVYVLFTNWDNAMDYSLINITVKVMLWTLLIFLVGLVSKVLATLLNIKSVIRKKVAFFLLLVVGFIVSNIYLKLLNPIYNKFGAFKK